MRIQNAAVVITGASSGLGRAAAHEFSRRGANVVLAARHAVELDHVAEECRGAGAAAVVAPTDVKDEAAVERLADAALEAFGTIDVWVNNAAVTYYAVLDEGSLGEHRGVLDANILGCVHGARVAVPIFKRRGRGVLINVSSILGEVGHPYVPSYVISKFAIRGLTETLRVSLADYPDIHVCTIFPYAIDTPHFLMADNAMGRRPRPMPPLQPPEKVARAIVGLAEHPRHERHVPSYFRWAVVLKSLFPTTTDEVLLHVLERYHLGVAVDTQSGNVARPQRIADEVHGSTGDAPRLAEVLAFAARDAGASIWRRSRGRLMRSLRPPVSMHRVV